MRLLRRPFRRDEWSLLGIAIAARPRTDGLLSFRLHMLDHASHGRAVEETITKLTFPSRHSNGHIIFPLLAPKNFRLIDGLQMVHL